MSPYGLLSFAELVAHLGNRGRRATVSRDLVEAHVELRGVGAYGRVVRVAETFWCHGMSSMGVAHKATLSLARLAQQFDRVVESQLEHADHYRGDHQ